MDTAAPTVTINRRARGTKWNRTYVWAWTVTDHTTARTAAGSADTKAQALSDSAATAANLGA